MFFAYVVQSLKNGRLYYGSTNNLGRRVKEHNSGQTLSLRYIRPVKLVYFEAANTLKEAREKEKFFKSGKGRELIRRKLARAVA